MLHFKTIAKKVALTIPFNLVLLRKCSVIKDRYSFRVALLLMVFGVPESVFAQGYCSSVSKAGLSFGCAELLSNSPILNNSPSPTNIYITPLTGAYDGLVWDSDWIAGSSIEPRLRFSADVKFPDEMTQSWRNVFIGSTRTDGAQTEVTATALPFGNSGTSEHVDVTLQFDRLFLENTNLLVLPGSENKNVLNTGTIEYFILGSAQGSEGGGLTLNNAGLAFNGNGLIGSTRLLMAAPVQTIPFIRAETGANTLSFGSQPNFAERVTISVLDGASLEFSGTELSTRIEGNLHIGSGGRLSLVNNSALSLLQNDETLLPRTTITGGSIELDGINTELLLTAPQVINGELSLKNGATMTVRERDTGNSRMSFSGDTLIKFDGPQTTIRGNAEAPNELTLEIGAGTTRFVGSVMPSSGKGLNVNTVSIDGGTLDWDNMLTNDAQQNAINSITVLNGGVFQEKVSRFRQLEELVVTNGTLRTHSILGSYTANDGINTAAFTDAVIDVIGASDSEPGLSAGLRATVINAKNLSFSGRNHVEIGISPDGECLLSVGACIPGTTRFAGQLVTNVGNDPRASLSGYDTLFFVPHAVNPTAPADAYITGGVNGRYTVATANSSSALTTQLQGIDAAPITPTSADLAAAGSNLPANLIYTIVNDPVADGRVDIAFHDIGLANHPKLATGYTPQFTNTVLVEPNSLNTQAVMVSILPDPEGTDARTWTVIEPQTSNVTTITQTAVLDPATGGRSQVITAVVTEPDGTVLSTESVSVPFDPNSGGGVQLITTTITEPDGDHVNSSMVIVPLDPTTGTTNAANYAKLVNSNNGTLMHGGLIGVETLHPEAYASYMTVALEHSDHLRNIVLANAHGTAPTGERVEGVTKSGRKIWLDSSLMRGTVDGDAGLAGFSYDLGEIVLGGELWSNEMTNVGAYAGYGAYSMGEHTSSASSLRFASDAYHLGAYGTHELANWSMMGMAGVSWANTKTTREAVTHNGSNIHKASYDSKTFEAAVHAEYNGVTSTGPWQIVPEVGLGYAHYSQNRITETGASDTALTIQEATAESLVGSLGINMTGPEFGAGLKPLAFVRYEHDFVASRDKEHEINAAFASSPATSQAFVGSNRGPKAVSIGFGLNSAAGTFVDVSAGLVYTKNTNGDELGGGLGITWAF